MTPFHIFLSGVIVGWLASAPFWSGLGMFLESALIRNKLLAEEFKTGKCSFCGRLRAGYYKLMVGGGVRAE